MTPETPIKVLVVDDNDQYREALRRMLQLEDFEVCEAADLDQALNGIQTQSPDVVVTDLQMRTDREGLDLIEILKGYDPVLPVIMISAVGSFEEGALATQLGAVHVVHKSRIEEEMGPFLETIRQSYRDAARSREWLALIAAARQNDAREEEDTKVAQIKGLLAVLGVWFQDHLPDQGQSVSFEEHVLCSTKPDTLGAESEGVLCLLGLVGVRVDTHLGDFLSPRHQPVVHPIQTGVFGIQVAVNQDPDDL